MSNEALKLCPFCGGKAVVHVNDGVRVVCTKCGTSTRCLVDGYSEGVPTGRAVDSVVKAWNRREGSE